MHYLLTVENVVNMSWLLEMELAKFINHSIDQGQ